MSDLSLSEVKAFVQEVKKYRSAENKVKRTKPYDLKYSEVCKIAREAGYDLDFSANALLKKIDECINEVQRKLVF